MLDKWTRNALEKHKSTEHRGLKHWSISIRPLWSCVLWVGPELTRKCDNTNSNMTKRWWDSLCPDMHPLSHLSPASAPHLHYGPDVISHSGLGRWGMGRVWGGKKAPVVVVMIDRAQSTLPYLHCIVVEKAYSANHSFAHTVTYSALHCASTTSEVQRKYILAQYIAVLYDAVHWVECSAFTGHCMQCIFRTQCMFSALVQSILDSAIQFSALVQCILLGPSAVKDGWVGFFWSSVGRRRDRHQGFPHDDAQDAAHDDDDADN